MITKEQAIALKRIIRRVVRAEIADSWKGAGDPESFSYIEEELYESKKALKAFIKTLETTDVSQSDGIRTS